ncbi:MAG: Protein UmuD [Rhodocyclaceae bacterium]|nr:Protein UmuD [Rhodocyclaceae bacterium]CAG0932065.1 DNA polymerase V [Rhodocyclaceae bacterium]
MIFAPAPDAPRQERPLFLSRVPAAADEHAEGSLDLNEHLVAHREATFLIRVRSEAMVGAGVHDGDLLVVDRALEPADGDLVVAEEDGGLTLKRFLRRNGHVRLLPENPCHRPNPLADDPALSIWGVATSVVHRLK